MLILCWIVCHLSSTSLCLWLCRIGIGPRWHEKERSYSTCNRTWWLRLQEMFGHCDTDIMPYQQWCHVSWGYDTRHSCLIIMANKSETGERKESKLSLSETVKPNEIEAESEASAGFSVLLFSLDAEKRHSRTIFSVHFLMKLVCIYYYFNVKHNSLAVVVYNVCENENKSATMLVVASSASVSAFRQHRKDT